VESLFGFFVTTLPLFWGSRGGYKGVLLLQFWQREPSETPKLLCENAAHMVVLGKVENEL